MTVSDIISIGVLAMLVADVAASVFLVRPYTKLKARYEELSKMSQIALSSAEKNQSHSFQLLDKYSNQITEIKRLEKEVEMWKARSVS